MEPELAMEPMLFCQPHESNAAATPNKCQAERPTAALARRDKFLPVFPADIWVRQANSWCLYPFVTFITSCTAIPDGST